MNRYKRIISLRSFLLVFIRRIKLFLIIFIPLSVIAIIIPQNTIVKEYSAYVSLSRIDGISPSIYPIIPNYIKSEDTLILIEETLLKKEIKHFNGETILTNEIQNGIKIASSISSVVNSVKLSFVSFDKIIIQPILREISNTIISCSDIKSRLTQLTASEPSSVNKISNEDTYSAVGLLTSFTMAFVVAFIYDCYFDFVFDAKDIEDLGCEGFEISVLDKNNHVIKPH